MVSAQHRVRWAPTPTRSPHSRRAGGPSPSRAATAGQHLLRSCLPRVPQRRHRRPASRPRTAADRRRGACMPPCLASPACATGFRRSAGARTHRRGLVYVHALLNSDRDRELGLGRFPAASAMEEDGRTVWAVHGAATRCASLLALPTGTP